ncbi:MAG: hypothetical protein LWY06_05400 [Firmicutes bacterium]|nr:hypothetical protein [Bacillota bacterium]
MGKDNVHYTYVLRDCVKTYFEGHFSGKKTNLVKIKDSEVNSIQVKP